jgi:hypothetical protein
VIIRPAVDFYFQRCLEYRGEWIPGPADAGYYLQFKSRSAWDQMVDEIRAMDDLAFRSIGRGNDAGVLFHDASFAGWVSRQNFGFIRFDQLWLVTAVGPTWGPSKEIRVQEVDRDIRESASRLLAEEPAVKTVRTYNNVRYSKVRVDHVFDARQRRDRPCVKATEEVTGKEVVLFTANVPKQAQDFIDRMGTAEAFSTKPFNDRDVSDFL